MTAGYLLQQLANGLSNGAVYAIFALGYTLVFSILDILNFTQGAVFAVGAYLTYSLMTGHIGGGQLHLHLGLRLPLWLAFTAGALISGLLGVAIEFLVFRPLRRRRADPLLALVASIGLATLLVNALQLIYGAQNHNFPFHALGSLPPVVYLGPVIVRSIQLIILGVTLLALAALWLFSRSRYGKALFAVAENPAVASLLGISVSRYIVWTFFLSGLLGGIAGTLVGLSYSISPYFGQNYGLIGLAVIVLGGLGDIPGAVVGGLVMGVIEALTVGVLDFYISGVGSGYQDAISFGILLLVLLFRPQGLLGRKLVQRV
jgi:branched-chain amino acid transport system permease protein